jgi:transposase-like protein
MASRNNGKYDEDFKQGAVALVFETEKPIAQGAPRTRHQRRHAGHLGRQGAPCCGRRGLP